MNKMDPERLRDLASNEHRANKKLAKKLKAEKKGALVNELVKETHDELFAEFDCLECANCCKSISPIIYEKDIDRIARKLKIKPAKFTEEYLKIDEEGDYVFKKTPCPFLLPDNYCSIYEVRPKSCRDYPHIDHRNFIKIISDSVKNTFVCPIVRKLHKKLIGRFL